MLNERQETALQLVVIMASMNWSGFVYDRIESIWMEKICKKCMYIIKWCEPFEITMQNQQVYPFNLSAV